MKINKQHGFSVVEGLLIFIIIGIIGGTGWYVVNANKNADDTLNNAGLGNATKTSKDPTPKSDPTAGWTSYSNKEGKYSLKYPSNWVKASNPEACTEGTFLLGPTESSVGKCATDGGGQMMFYSFSVESGPMGLTDEYYDDIKTESVTVNGVKGERQSGTYTYEGEGIGPEKGTKAIEYIFKTNGLIYKAVYSQQPSFPDVQKEFDLIVTKTLKFSAN